MAQGPPASSCRATTRWIELGAASIGLFVLTGGPSSLLTQRFTSGGPDFEIWTYQYPFGVVGLLGAVMFGARVRRPRAWQALLALVGVAAFVAWSLLSVSWSVIPALTSSRAMTSAGVALFALWFGLGLEPARQRLAVGVATASFVVISALLVVGAPAYGRGVFRDNVTTQRFRGLAPNPNSLGPVCVVAIVTAVSLLMSTRDIRSRVAWALIAGTGSVLLIGSGSDTALVGLMAGGVMAGVIALVGVARRRAVAARTVGIAAVAAIMVVAVVGARWMWSISELLTGDDTFGNRRSIWTRIWGVIELRPWRGWGYWAYWNVTGSGAVVRYGSAHNSVLEAWLGLGVIGVALFALVVVLAVAGAARAVWSTWSPVSWWIAVLLTCLLVGHLTESFILWHSYNWAIVCGLAAGTWTLRSAVQPDMTPTAPARASAANVSAPSISNPRSGSTER